MLRIDMRHRVPGHVCDGLAGCDRLRHAHLNGIHAGDMMDHDADGPAVFGDDSLPFCIGETLGKSCKSVCPLHKPIGECMSSIVHKLLLSGYVDVYMGIAGDFKLQFSRLNPNRASSMAEQVLTPHILAPRTSGPYSSWRTGHQQKAGRMPALCIVKTPAAPSQGS